MIRVRSSMDRTSSEGSDGACGSRRVQAAKVRTAAVRAKAGSSNTAGSTGTRGRENSRAGAFVLAAWTAPDTAAPVRRLRASTQTIQATAAVAAPMTRYSQIWESTQNRKPMTARTPTSEELEALR